VCTAISACSFALVEVYDARTWLTVSNVALLVGAYVCAVAVGLAGQPPPAALPAPAERGDALTGTGLAALRLVRVTLRAPIVALASTFIRGTSISPTLTVLCCLLFLMIAAGIGVFIHQITVLTLQLSRTKDHFRGLVESSSDVLTVLDDQLRIVFASPAAGSVLGMEPGKLVGLRLPDLVGPADRDGLTRSLTTGAAAAHVLLDQDDDVRELEVVAEGRSESGLIVRLRDVTDRRQHERALERMAYTDQLTGLPNRAAFFASLSRWIGEFGADGHTSLMVLDLDGFKAVNDTAGHEAGDQLLVEVGRRLRRVVRDEDVVARLGGDEFALLVRGTPAEVDDVARRLVASVSLPHATPVGTFAVGASIGVTTMGSGGGHLAFREADTALRSAKDLGKGIVRRFSARTLRESHRTATLAAELGDALRSGAMQVRYRPSTAPASGRVTMLEATPTWLHESLGEIGEGELRALCARNSLTNELQDWLVLEAAREIGSVLRSGADVQLAITVPADYRLSGGHIAATDWLDALGVTGVRPEHLLLLITEEALMTSTSGLVPVLEEAHQRGVQLCLADYGLGHTMIAHRSVLPFDMIRLDLRVMGGDGAERVALAARSAVAVGDVFGMRTLLDGVATAEQYALACDLAVTGISGPFVHTAVTAGELPALLDLPAAGLAADDLLADLDGPGDGPVAVELSPGLTP
jgi:diguanylate cyclase (GGDEF)-like protein/PAS domain S-box-containing protein